MVSCFVLYAKEDARCGEEVRLGLEGLGYRCWREPATLALDAVLYPRTVEHALLGSAVVVLVWSGAAASSEWVERLLLLAQQLRKQIVSISLDVTALPTTLVATTVVASQGSCAGSVAQLKAVLPAADDTDELFALAERAAHPYLRERKAAVEQAVEMLRRGVQPGVQQGTQPDEQREALFALLGYLALHDVMDGVRIKAQKAIDAATTSGALGPAGLRLGDARHIFGVRCKNRHVSYFDKRDVCKASFQVPRGLMQRAGKELDELYLACDTCGVQVVVHVDCEDYR